MGNQPTIFVNRRNSRVYRGFTGTVSDGVARDAVGTALSIMGRHIATVRFRKAESRVARMVS